MFSFVFPSAAKLAEHYFLPGFEVKATSSKMMKTAAESEIVKPNQGLDNLSDITLGLPDIEVLTFGEDDTSNFMAQMEDEDSDTGIQESFLETQLKRVESRQLLHFKTRDQTRKIPTVQTAVSNLVSPKKETQEGNAARAEAQVAREREHALQVYKDAMTSDNTLDLDLILLHRDALAKVSTCFTNKTCHLPQKFVRPNKQLLLQEAELEFQELKNRIGRQVDARRLDHASTEALNTYKTSFQNTLEFLGPLAFEEDGEKEAHEIARQDALSLFDIQTYEVSEQALEAARVKLNAELLKQLEYNLLQSAVMKRLQELTLAVDEALDVYTNEKAKLDASQTGDEAAAVIDIEEQHKLALSLALDSFDLNVSHKQYGDTNANRLKLIEEIQSIHQHSKTQRDSAILAEQQRQVEENFSQRISKAAQNVDSWSLGQKEAKAEALAQFDEGTSHINNPEKAFYRERLEKAIEFSLSLVKTFRQSSGDSRDCCICTDRRSNLAFQPCGHITCCYECGTRLNCCPTCRGNCSGYLRIYL